MIAKKSVSLQAMKTLSKIGFFILTIAILTGCGSYEKLLKGHDYEAQYEAAVKYYNERNYTKAIQLFENLIMHYHNKDYTENISWYYAESLLAERDYYSASYQYKSFFKRFRYSDHAEEALFKAADCKYHLSPEYYLDQQITKEAISEYESFVDRYPTSIHVPEINSHLDELRDKLMRKDYEIAYNYYLTENYNAAYVSMMSFLNNYPDSKLREDAMFYLLASGYQYGINSREDKMRERLQQMINDFDRFATLFQNSKYLEQAQGFYTKAKAALATMEK